MTDNTAATAPRTPGRNSVLSPLESIPHAVGSSVVSEHISAVGVDVSDVRPLIGREVRDFKGCTVDDIRQALLERCTGSSQSFPEKLPTLLETSIKTVLPLYNGPGIAPKIKQFLSDFCDPEKEAATYFRFVDAANSALVELKNVNAPGIPAFESLKTNILFHVNDPKNISQEHQGKMSTCRPDIVVVSYDSPSDALAKKKEKKLHPIVQNGLYVAEMFAAHIARLHVISLIVNNDIIYIRYFDRQYAIQCSGTNFVQDLPRFTVLPLNCSACDTSSGALTRYSNLNPDFQLYLNSQGRTTHFGLRGRATTVFPVQSKVLSNLPKKSYFLNKSTELVAKEGARQSEPDILEEVYKIAKEEPDVLGHVPEIVWFYKFDGTSTAIIRRALGFDNAELGHRVLHIIVFKKLTPITTLEKKEFLVAWWDVVKCHRALWRRGVHHRDVSPKNLMGYRLDGRFISVFNDFDLASIKQRPKGFERTGTVPFMALKLFTRRAIAGEVEHVYQHVAESFIWVLTWICLRYQGGELLRKNRPLDEWLTVDVKGCLGKKMSFITELLDMRPTRSHKDNFNVAMHGLAVVYKYIFPFETVPTDDEVVFQALLQDHVPADVREGNILPGQP